MQPLRYRRPLPGSRRFDAISGPATIVAGTRAGVQRIRGRNPAHYLIAPIDLDPATVAWSVNGGHLCLFCADAPEEFLLRLVQALLADGAESVVRLTIPVQIHRRPPV
jgi:hypothetical protein